MTLLPAANRDVKGVEYGTKHPKYRVGPLCSIPGCSRLSDHAHHIWRRSFLAGDYGWVKLWDGTIVQNLMPICWRHHDDVTNNKARVAYDDESKMFFYVEHPSGSSDEGSTELVVRPTYEVRGNYPLIALDPQPSVREKITDEGRNKLRPINDEHIHDGPGAGDNCPTCKRRMPKKKTGTVEAKRPRKSWNITVPVDERENGAEVLNTLLEECAKIFHHDETKQVKYFTLAQALALVVQDYAGT